MFDDLINGYSSKSSEIKDKPEDLKNNRNEGYTGTNDFSISVSGTSGCSGKSSTSGSSSISGTSCRFNMPRLSYIKKIRDYIKTLRHLQITTRGI